MNNHPISKRFQEIADALEQGGANPFRVKAYRKAARTIERLKEDVATWAESKSLDEIPGIGADLAGKINEYIKTGRISDPPLEKSPPADTSAKLPETYQALIAAGVMDLRLAHFIYRRFLIENLEDLERLVQSHLLRTLPNFRPEVEQKMLNGLQKLKRDQSTNSP